MFMDTLDKTKAATKYTVIQGVAFATIGNSITRNYVEIDGQRIYVFGAQPGDELSKSEARRLATEPKPVDNSIKE